MNIIVLGASRGTGLYAAKLAIENGHRVTAVSRHVEAIKELKDGVPSEMRICLKIVSGDVLVPSSFEPELNGQDVVISSIGVTNTKATSLYSQGISNIIQAMLKHNVKRLICVSGVGVEVTPGMSFLLRLLTRWVVQPLLKNNFTDLLKMEDIVRQSTLDWTIVRAPRLANGDMTGKYRFAANEYLRNPLLLKRSDLAHFIITQMENKNLYGSRVEVAN